MPAKVVTPDELAVEISRVAASASSDCEELQITLWFETAALYEGELPPLRSSLPPLWVPSSAQVTAHRPGGWIAYGGDCYSLTFDLEDARRNPAAVAREALIEATVFAHDTFAVPDEPALLGRAPDWLLDALRRALQAEPGEEVTS